jgi:hypothetical protein
MNAIIKETDFSNVIGGKSGDDTILIKVWLKNKLNEIRK